ncbi:MAG: hypothetical protein AB7L84_13725 [Acidimicrobiia bacterium]
MRVKGPAPDSGLVERLRAASERLDDLQAARPLPFNLATGVLLGLVGLLLGLHPLFAALWAVSWTALRTWLWRPDAVLRRQHEARRIRSGRPQT